MLQIERFELILDVVNEHKVATIEQLCEKCNVSKATVRRDLKELESSNKLIRAHGGAISITKNIAVEPSFEIRKSWYIEEKQRIAEAAIAHIKEGEVIILDSGTTTLHLAKKLPPTKNITVVTNDIYIAMELARKSFPNLIVLGGNLRKDSYTLTGYFTVDILNNIRADKLFIGADAIDLENGYMNYNVEELPVKKAMIKISKEKIVLCDHSKFEIVGFAKICAINCIDRIITGVESKTEILEQIKQEGTEVEIV